MHLADFIEERLEGSGLDLADLRELLVRLLNYGVLCREENQTERDLYDRFLRCEALLLELCDLLAIRIHHDRRFEYVRLYPPGARTPGMEGAEEHAFAGSLRARLSQGEVALLLVLRAQYDKAIREGKVDERGFAAESLESLGIAAKSLLGRPLPDKLTERRRAFARLKQLRLIDYRQEEELEDPEAWLRIHPMIVDFVSADALAALREGGEQAAIADLADDFEVAPEPIPTPAPAPQATPEPTPPPTLLQPEPPEDVAARHLLASVIAQRASAAEADEEEDGSTEPPAAAQALAPKGRKRATAPDPAGTPPARKPRSGKGKDGQEPAKARPKATPRRRKAGDQS